ncbi:MAG: protein-export chaperone SecB [Alphaproteobacteria bacterium]|nr:protein-export chaperone SecB [Alphaproteobacteria bacterium]
MSDAIPGRPNGDGGPSPQEVRVQILGQYVKDLSFENPAAGNAVQQPQIELGVDLQARRLDQERFEVELKLRVSAKAVEKPVFLLELAYCGLFGIQNAPEDVLQQFLLIEAPHILFPFARRIVADAVRDGGMPPLLIEPIDFGSLYRARQAQAAQGMQPAV